MPSFEMRDRRGVGRNRDRRLERIALGGHDLALAVQVKRAGARVAGLAAGQRDLEEAGAFDREVERAAASLRRLPVLKLRAVATARDAEAGFEADRRFGLLRRRRARRLDLLVDQVLELDAALLEAGRVDVGQVVRDVVDVGLLRVHAAGGRIQCANHGCLSFSLPICARVADRSTRPSTTTLDLLIHPSITAASSAIARPSRSFISIDTPRCRPRRSA